MNELKTEKQTKLLVIHTALTPYRVDIFNALSNICELKLVLLNENNANQHFDQCELLARLNIKPDYISRNIRIINRDFPFGIRALIEGGKPDIVVTSEFSIATCIVALYKRLRQKEFCHVIWTDDNKELLKSDSIHRRVARRLFSPLVNGWIFISHETQEHYAKVFLVNKPSAIIPVIHEDEAFRSQLRESEQIFQKMVLDFDLSGKRILLFVGRLVELKGIDLLLRAYANILSRIDNSMLIIVGEGEERQNLELLTSSLGIDSYVKFVGRYEGVELLAWYRVGQVFALASHFEAFGAVVNEALLAGLPVVVSKNAGARSLIDEGINGSIVSPEDTEQFTRELILWLKKAPPLSIEEPIRPNLMKSEFADAINSVSKLFSTIL